MKSLAIALVVSTLGMMTAGCMSSPGYSGGLPSMQFPEERASGETSNRIARNWVYDSKQITDDFNSVMLLENPSRMTKWNVR